jgi:hypothetical protein
MRGAHFVPIEIPSFLIIMIIVDYKQEYMCDNDNCGLETDTSV